jgi:hypothetical protein
MLCYSVTKIEKINLEQSYAIKFCVKLGEGTTDTYGKIQKAFGNDSVSRVQALRWHKDFVYGRETVEGEPRSGRPASVKRSKYVDCVRVYVCQDRCLTIE